MKMSIHFGSTFIMRSVSILVRCSDGLSHLTPKKSMENTKIELKTKDNIDGNMKMMNGTTDQSFIV